MVEISMPLNRERVSALLVKSEYDDFKITNVEEKGIKLHVSIDGDASVAAKVIKAQLKSELGPGFFFAVNAV